MSRVIKFRGWDGKRIHNDVVVYMGAGWLENESLDPKAIHVNPDGLSCLMQFTGLKDNSGVDIYEGDIVQHYDADHYNNTTPKFKGGVFVCEFNNKEARFINAWCFYGVEVIGNIHESPELLKGNKND